LHSPDRFLHGLSHRRVLHKLINLFQTLHNTQGFVLFDSFALRNTLVAARNYFISFYIKRWKINPMKQISEKLIVVYLVKMFSAFYGTRRFMIVSTRACCWTLSWASWIQSTLYLSVYKIHFNISLTFQRRLNLLSCP
jgi:hypothetical protein